MHNLDQSNITDAVLQSIQNTNDPRLKEIMSRLVQHLHDFAREVSLTEQEWLYAIEFLTRVGQTCDEKRQEFILLSDVLGLSSLVDMINQRKPVGCTESTPIGPFHTQQSPEVKKTVMSRKVLQAQSVTLKVPCVGCRVNGCRMHN